MNTKQKLESLLAEYRQNQANLTIAQVGDLTEQIKQARHAVQAELSAGASPCIECGAIPHVIEQERGAGGMNLVYYEVGCLTPHTETRRVKNQNLQNAIGDWNDNHAVAG